METLSIRKGFSQIYVIWLEANQKNFAASRLCRDSLTTTIKKLRALVPSWQNLP